MIFFVLIKTFGIMNNVASLFPEPNHFEQLKNCQEPKDFLKRARSLMVVVLTPPSKNYEDFSRRVLEFNGKSPFNFPHPPLLKKYEKVCSNH